MSFEKKEKEYVILVNEQDQEGEYMEKLEAHQKGLLHRCFSILIFNDKGQTLIQQRAKDKYHCPGLRANTCCSHPRPGETNENAAHRRLNEELGFDCPIKEIGTFIYKANFDNGLTEHELDHLFIGKRNGNAIINPKEVEATKRIKLADLQKEMQEKTESFTPRFHIIIQDHLPLILSQISTFSYETT